MLDCSYSFYPVIIYLLFCTQYCASVYVQDSQVDQPHG